MDLEKMMNPALRAFMLTLLMAMGLAGCNTMAGMGEDVEEAGESIEEEAED